jgi:hypothetical protein
MKTALITLLTISTTIGFCQNCCNVYPHVYKDGYFTVATLDGKYANWTVGNSDPRYGQNFKFVIFNDTTCYKVCATYYLEEYDINCTTCTLYQPIPNNSRNCIPMIFPNEYNPVCASNGLEYSNEWFARLDGEINWSENECCTDLPNTLNQNTPTIVWPNPTMGQINIICKDFSCVTFYDFVGRKLSENFSPQFFAVQPQGIYILKITKKNITSSEYKIIIIQY